MPPLPAVVEGALRPLGRGPAFLGLLGSDAILDAVHHPPQYAFPSLVFAQSVNPTPSQCSMGSLVALLLRLSQQSGSVYRHHAWWVQLGRTFRKTLHTCIHASFCLSGN